MKYSKLPFSLTAHDGYMHVVGTDFSPVHTFECGQCFRFDADANGVYSGVAFGRPLSVWRDGAGLCVSGGEADFLSLWLPFLDLGRDYSAIDKTLPTDEFTAAAAAHGHGLRILRQQPWEALCSFIISQCNNIPRIKSIISTLCERFGEPLEHSGRTLYTFPGPEKLALLEASDLACLRAGYRAAYIISAARAICCGSFSFEMLEGLDTAGARSAVMSLDGVGDKVANCFLLFGMGRLDAFPVDTWMKKASAFYPGGFPAHSFGEYAGVAQQYIFYYARSKKMKNSIDNDNP